MDAPPEVEEWGQRATYHGGLPKQWRLHGLWEDANTYSRVGDFLRWKRTLDVIYRELVFIMKKDEQTETRKLIEKQVVPALKNFTGISGNKGITSGIVSQSNDLAYQKCIEYEIKLRKISGRHGLDMPKADDPRYAFSSGMRS